MRTHRNLAIVAFAACVMVAGHARADDKKPKPDLAELQGTWTLPPGVSAMPNRLPNARLMPRSHFVPMP